ncbi:MAG: c-type cytochrome biogenesis protein CcmI [Alphaproteobacteria bacterium]|nr:c-type cytochrome biogenesis protein CcmI [Alphaproteobacteria bacterium]
MLWLIFAVLLLAVLAILLVPLLMRSSTEAPRRVDYDIVVYRNQLAEIEQEIERGLLTEAEAVGARAEVHRRMLAAEDADLKRLGKPARRDNRHARIAAIAAITIILPLGSAAVYGALGSPNLPGKPYAWRLQHDPQFIVAKTAEKLANLLKSNPSATGYKRLAEMYFNVGNYEQAADADRQAVALAANDSATWSEFGESVTMANGGAIVPEAFKAFTSALAVDPHDYRARFYIGLAETQIGNLKQAVAIWRDLEKDAPADATWLPMVRQHIASFAKAGDFNPTSVPPSPPSLLSLNASAAAMSDAMHLHTSALAGSGASEDSAAASADTNAAAGDRDTMIHAMVAKLADRMKKNPGDAAGWQRLARSYNVLGEHDKARAAIAHAVRLKPNDVGMLLALSEIQKSAAVPGDDTPPDFVKTMRGVLKLDPANLQALYYVGLAEQKAGHLDRARLLWNKALSVADATDPLAVSIHNRLDTLSGKAN